MYNGFAFFSEPVRQTEPHVPARRAGSNGSSNSSSLKDRHPHPSQHPLQHSSQQQTGAGNSRSIPRIQHSDGETAAEQYHGSDVQLIHQQLRRRDELEHCRREGQFVVRSIKKKMDKVALSLHLRKIMRSTEGFVCNLQLP